LPSWVKLSVSDAAANTVIVPVEGELPALGELVLLEQPAAAAAASTAAITAKRRIVNSSVES
jgi:hypothetical protein